MGSTANFGAVQGEQISNATDTHFASPASVLLWVRVLGFKTYQESCFCDNLPSAAPSVRWTEGAARHL